MSTRALRRPARVLAVLAIVTPAAGLLLATPALAASGSIDKPTADAVFSDGATSVAADATGTMSSGDKVKLATTEGPPGTDLSQNVSTTNCTSTLTTSCAGKPFHLAYSVEVSAARPNGRFTLTLTAGSTLIDAVHFYTNYKPTADPANLAAAANGRNEVDLSWSYTGTEPDKAGFEIAETHNGATRTLQVGPSSCNGSTCGYAITGYATPAAGTTDSYSYTVTALRQSGGCSSCGSVTRSAASSSAGAQLVGPPPSPTPTPSSGTGGGSTGTQPTSTGGSAGPSSGGAAGGSGATGGAGTAAGSSGTGGGAGTHGSTGSSGSAAKPITIPTLPPLVQSRRAFALGFNSFSPSLGIPKLPPLPATTFPVVEPGSGGVYQPTLPYATRAPRKTTSVLSSPIASISSSLNTHALLPLLAMSLILLAVAAHVRVFLGRTIDD